MPFGLILDIVVAVLLVVTICYAVMLNRRLGKLRRDKEELNELARTFGDATVRADEAIGKLRATASSLEERIAKAEQLRDDLVFLVERGGTTADELERLVRQARDDIGVVPKPRPAEAAPVAKQIGIETRDDAEAAAHEAMGRETMDREAAGRDETPSDIDDEPRSEAERALLKALRSAG